MDICVRHARRLAAAIAFAVVAVLTLCVSNPAYASTLGTAKHGTAGHSTVRVTPEYETWPTNPIQWKNVTSGNCVSSKGTSAPNAGEVGNAYTGACLQCGIFSCSATSTSQWIDPSLGGGLHYEILNSTWNRFTYLNSSDYCLDSNFSGAVYTISCNGGDWQKWLELSTPTGWALQDYHTGLWLDGGGGVYGYGLYTNTNYGDSDHYQRWT